MERPNLSYIHSMSGGDTKFEQQLISIIKIEFEKEKLTYLNNFKAKNYVHMADNVHKIKHKIGILGLEKSYQIAVEYENDLRVGTVKLKEKFDSILSVMTDFINQQ